MSTPAPNEPLRGRDALPEGFEPEEGVRYILQDNVLTILDDRTGDKSGGPLSPHMLEQLRQARRRLEGLPDEELPPPPAAAG
jgi:hypothetical protein